MDGWMNGWKNELDEWIDAYKNNSASWYKKLNVSLLKIKIYKLNFLHSYHLDTNCLKWIIW